MGEKVQVLNVFRDLGDRINFMPLFEFICKKCNKKFEALMFGKENIKCPECENDEILKQFSNFIIFTKVH
jgi:putative FmdB family regulatory protein